MQVRPLKSTKGNKFTACTKLLTPETKFLLKCQISYMVILIKKKKKNQRTTQEQQTHLFVPRGNSLNTKILSELQQHFKYKEHQILP